MIKIDIKSEKYNLSMVLKQKITVIRGDSGKGKSQIVKAVESTTGNYKINISDERYTLVTPPSYGEEWYKAISRDIEHNDKRIYVIDDVDYVFSKEFAKLFSTDKNSFYIIINRFNKFGMKSLGGLPFCIDEVYSFIAVGKNHHLEPYYKFDTDKEITAASINNILVEDSNSGFDFFKKLNQKTKSANGRDNICTELESLTGNVLLLADRAALGSCFDKIMEKAKMGKVGISIPKHYYSFEYMLLKSNWFSYNTNNISNDTICRYESAEQMYEDILERLTQGQPYNYQKTSLSACYADNCCAMPNKRQSAGGCNKGVAGQNKIQQLFRKTEFEQLVNIVPLI